MRDFAETNMRLLHKRDKLTAELKEQEARLLSRTQALKETQAELAGCEERLHTAQERRGETQRTVEASREELRRLQEQETALQKELTGVFALAFGKKRALRESIHETQHHLEDAQKRLSEAQTRLTEQSAETERLSLQLQKLKTNAAAQRTSLEELRTAISDGQAALRTVEAEIQQQEAARQKSVSQPPPTDAGRTATASEEFKRQEAAAMRDRDRRRSAAASSQDGMSKEAASQSFRQQEMESIKQREAARQAASEEAARKAAEERARKAAAEEAARKEAEEQARKAAAEEAARKEAEERARKAAAEEAARKQGSQPRATPLENALRRLEKLYPEHKIFALSAIDDELRERFTKLYREAGYNTVEELFAACGYEQIGGDAVRELRSSVIYTPGNEPDIIKNKIDSILRRLEEYYPDHIIPRGVELDHKQLGNNISGVYRWLGYSDVVSFFTAYGYTYQVGSTAGRPANDFQSMLDALTEKYRTQPKPTTMGALIFENPEYKGQLKTLQNLSQELFGMSLKRYFQQIGIIAQPASGTAARKKAGGPFQGIAAAFLEELYAGLDPSVYGTYEDAKRCAEGLVIKRRGQRIYVFEAVHCSPVIKIPYGVTAISPGVFQGEEALQEVFLPASMEEISQETFADCPNLSSVHLEEGPVAIRMDAFANCPRLSSITLPASIRQIEAGAFRGCPSLSKVTFLGTPWVSPTAFAGCAYVYEAPVNEATAASSFDYTLDRKGNAAITGYHGTDSDIVIPHTIEAHPVTSIAKEAFLGNPYLTSVSMPDSITAVQGGAFKDCISLKTVRLSNALPKIITSVFSGCIGLREINIPDATAELKSATFKDSPLEKLHIGKSLQSFTMKAFFKGDYDSVTGEQTSSRSIQTLTVDPENPYLQARGSCLFSDNGRTLLAALGDFRQYEVPEGVETIGPGAFEKLYLLSDITLPSTLTAISSRAFAYTGLRSVSFSASLKAIQEAAFVHCTKLTGVIFSEGLEEIGPRAFEDCPIVSVTLPSTLRTLGAYSFACLGGYYYDTVQSLSFRNNPYFKTDGIALYHLEGEQQTLQTVYDRSIRSGDSWEEERFDYKVLPGTTAIGPRAFYSCTLLRSVTLPEGLESIGESAFLECRNLTSVSLPQSLTTIGANAFHSTMIKTFSLPEGIRSIGPGAFATGSSWEDTRTALRSIRVPRDSPVFYVDQNLLLMRKEDGGSAVTAYFGGSEAVFLPEGVTEICTSAFYKSIVQEIHIPASVTAIGEKAFQDCRSLRRLWVSFSTPENGVDQAVVYIPEIHHNEYNYWDSSYQEQYMDCIRTGGIGGVFDFVKYDSLFETITDEKDKILIATDRLKSAIQLVPLYRENYLSYLQKNAELAVQVVISYDDLSGLNILAELGVFTGENIDASIELANSARKPEILSYLMNYKNAKIGIQETDYDL